MASNSLLTPSVITKESLLILVNNLVAAAKVNRQFENQFHKIGSTITVRKPNKFALRTGPAISIQNISEPSTSITVNNQIGFDFQFNMNELTLTVEEFAERYIKPGVEKVANKIDFDVLTLYKQVNNEVGTPGTVPNNFTALAAVGQRLDEGAVPQDGRTLVLNSAAYWSMSAALSTLYVNRVAEPALKGFLAAIANFEIFMDQNVQAQTVGAYAGTGVVNGAGQTGSNLVTNGWTANITGLFAIGDVITLPSVFAVNPQNLVSTGALMNFVVQSAVNSDASGNATIPLYPPITITGAYQTVSASPANLAPLTVKGTASTSYFQNVGFVKDAFGLVVVPMELPEGVDFKAREMVRNISMRIIRAYDVNNDVMPCRVDVLYGVSCFYPELACRLTN